MFSNFNVFKAETKCKLGLARIKLQRNKRNLAIKQLRKEVAELLRTGKLDSARIRVEGVIRENLMMQACDTLELYLELVTVRSQQIAQTREVPSDLTEAISSIIYAAARVKDIQELGELKIMFAAKYGKEYVNEAGNDATCRHWQVNEKLVRCLLVEPPQPEDKLATLSDIAQEAGIEWDMAAAANDMLPPGSRPGDHPPPGMPPTGPRGAEQARGPPPAFAHPEQPEAQPGQRSPPPDYAQPPPGQVARNHTAPYGFTPGGPPPPFMDPQQAAAAAAAAAAHARAMADYAAQLAVYQQAVEAAGQAAPEQLPPDMPPPGWLAAHPQATWHSGAVAQAGPDGFMPAPGPAPGVPFARSESAIRRAYEAAQGPPEKGEVPTQAAAWHHTSHAAENQPPHIYNDDLSPFAAGGLAKQVMGHVDHAGMPPPVAGPPDVPGPVLPAQSYLYENGPMSPFQAPDALKAPEVPEAPKVPTGTPETSLGLPHPPQGITKAPEPDDEYDDLARRLDALKRR